MIQTSKKIEKLLKLVIKESDILLEILDSRIPKLTRNPRIEKFITKSGKELILVLNKSDLVPKSFIEEVKEKFDWEYPTVYVSTKIRRGSRALRKAIKLSSDPKKDKISIGVIGFPNTGKSSIINLLVGRSVSKTAPIPGFTKGIQKVKLSRRYYLLDTPGTFPKLKDETLAVITGSLRPEKLKFPEKAAKYLIEKALEIGQIRNFETLYKVKLDVSNPESALEILSKKFNKDLRTTSIKILNDWIRGKLVLYWI